MTAEPNGDIDKTYLQTIFSNMMEGVVAVDLAGRVLFVNPALGRIFDINVTQAKGKRLLEVLRQNQLNALLQNALQEQTKRTDEVRIFSPDEHVFEAIAAPLLENDQCVGALLVLYDITKVRKLEQIRRDFVANVSHELRTPLASIKAFAETLRDGAMNDPKHAPEFLKAIEKHTDDMTVLVDDLLDLSAIESGQRAPEKEAVHLADVLRDVIKGLTPIANRKKILINNEAAESAPAVLSDRGQLKQMLANLLENAIKFNQDGGRIAVKALRTGTMIQIEITDSGMGIPSQDLPRIFERFYRVDKGRSREMGGTGLGLSIVKHLVEINGGSVRAESSVGKGSTFFVTLPAAG